MIRAHLPGVLAWTRLRVSNGALEGMNNGSSGFSDAISALAFMSTLRSVAATKGAADAAEGRRPARW